jgi:uncharacterized protein YecE (DUF72 family)
MARPTRTLFPSLFEASPEPAGGCVRFGTSSFSAPEWVGTFYPRGLQPAEFLRYYATQFDTVEVDATYYHVPGPETVDAWREKTPEDFALAAKFPRTIVHAGEGPDPDPRRLLDRDVTYAQRDAFLEAMRRLGGRLGPLVLQFPFFPRGCFASRGAFRDRLERFLEDLPPGFAVCVEIRNRDWLDAEFAALCRRRRAALVLVDRAGMPHGDEVAGRLDSVTADFAYVRLLGDRQRIERITTRWDREVLDHRESLERWAALLVRLAERRVATYVYANNHYAGHAPTTIRRLQAMFQRTAARDHPASKGDTSATPAGARRSSGPGTGSP